VCSYVDIDMNIGFVTLLLLLIYTKITNHISVKGYNSSLSSLSGVTNSHEYTHIISKSHILSIVPIRMNNPSYPQSPQAIPNRASPI